MEQARTFHRKQAKDATDRERVMPFDAPQLTTLQTRPLWQQKTRYLSLDHDLLKIFQNHFTLCQSQAQRLRFQIAPLQACDLARLLVAAFADGHHLNFADHRRTSRSWLNNRN